MLKMEQRRNKNKKKEEGKKIWAGKKQLWRARHDACDVKRGDKIRRDKIRFDILSRVV